MEFINIINKLKEDYRDNHIVRKNGTILLGPDKIPRSRHMLFKPLSEEHIKTYLIGEYLNKFPEDYIRFLKYSNGGDFYGVKLKTEQFCFAHSMFIIFGLPLTPPFGRALDMEEPYDLRIEDLARHDDIPGTWLKCGTYTKNYDFNVMNDIFIDTVTNKVFACEKNEKDIVDSWSNLDECFCSIYKSFIDCKYEYEDN